MGERRCWGLDPQRKFATDLEAASKALQDAEEKASRAEGEVRAQMEERHQQEVAALKVRDGTEKRVRCRQHHTCC